MRLSGKLGSFASMEAGGEWVMPGTSNKIYEITKQNIKGFLIITQSNTVGKVNTQGTVACLKIQKFVIPGISDFKSTRNLPAALKTCRSLISNFSTVDSVKNQSS